MIAQPDQLVNATILLASASPRRRELIRLLGLPIETASADIDETPLDGEHAADMAIRLSHEKASVAARLCRIPNSEFHIIVASDTVVSLDGQPLGKPRDADDARSMLMRLRHRMHQVYTAITLIDTRTHASITDLACSDVPMRDYGDAEIEAYIASGDPFDKAGAYAIQHAGFHPVDRLRACFANVMGLPLCHVVRSLRQLGIEPITNVPAACQAHIKYQCPVFDAILAGDG
jgi:MAF protein